MNENKINIPWYRRSVKPKINEEVTIKPLPTQRINLPKPNQPFRELTPEPLLEEVTNPLKQPVKFPLEEPAPSIFPMPIPLPGRNNEETGKEPVPFPLFQKNIETLTKGAVTLYMASEKISKFVETNITDPIYNAMMADPVLGVVLREAQKANMDMEIVVNYFANYDWDNPNIEQMTKDLIFLIGIGGAIRLLIFIIGRKVAFRI